MSDQGWWLLLLLGAGAHAGLELVVHLVVYPALADASAGGTGLARAGHERHTRRMGVAVAPVYGVLVLAAAGVALADGSALAWAAAVTVLLTLAVTGLLAVPLHGALVRCDDPVVAAGLHRRLARADLLRLVLAVALLPLVWAGATG